MIFTELQITNLRNLESLRLSLDSLFTIITGKNGSGKTSVLEAIYLLSCARSFRAREAVSLITYNKESLTVFARTDDNQQIAIKKSTHSNTVALINQQPCVSSSELAYFIPCQLFYADIFDFINTGPAIRRSILDWGVFHFDYSFAPLWKNYRHILKQKNALFKQKKSHQFHIPWDYQLQDLSDKIHAKRQKYIDELSVVFPIILSELSELKCFIRYEKGWDKKKEQLSLLTILTDNFPRDALRQRTQFGPHNADLQILSDDLKVKHGLSRGQQKIAMFALKFAQAHVLKKKCIYLIDDLESELDILHIEKILNYLKKISAQVIITGHSSELLLTHLPHSLHYVLDQGRVA